jgi:hypothetical protein
MRRAIRQELKAGFEAANDLVQPEPGLAERARNRARRRRRMLAALATLSAVALLAAGTTAALAHQRRAAVARQQPQASRRLLAAHDQVTELAVSGPYLYVLSDPGNTLAAYDRATGKLIRRVTPPASATSFAVGPGSLVWLSFAAAHDGGPTGTWLLSPDLHLHSVGPGGYQSLLPVGRTTAWSPHQYGLYRLRLPTPGSTGPASWKLQPGTSIGPPLNTAPGEAVLLGGNVVVGVTDGYGYHSHLVIAGQPQLSYGGGPQTFVEAFVSTGTSLWVISGNETGEPSGQETVSQGGAVVRLDSRLRPDTPDAVLRSHLLADAVDVWSYGDTIWVALGPATWAAGPSLACFTTGSRVGRVTTVPVRGEVAALAATGDTVYVSTQPPGQGAVTSGVTAYPVPASCR